jgi:hypothetical protein
MHQALEPWKHMVCVLTHLILPHDVVELQEVPEDFSVERLLECVKAAHLREVDEARNAHRMLNESQLRSLTLDQLLEMQENITNIVKEKRTQENECSVCQDRVKAMACVPCGHRFCSEVTT